MVAVINHSMECSRRRLLIAVTVHLTAVTSDLCYL